jgi:hypothetical protein
MKEFPLQIWSYLHKYRRKISFFQRLDFNFIIVFIPVRFNTKKQSFETEHSFFQHTAHKNPLRLPKEIYY